MRVQEMIECIGADFYTGVPDSQLQALCNYLINTYQFDPKHHIIAANEGNAAALAAGYYLSTGHIPVVYLQNSGLGNLLNPAVSLLHHKVYAIPVIFIIGWRGEPGIYDEPQHIVQGEITQKLLRDMDIQYFVIGQDTSVEELKLVMCELQEYLNQGISVAFIVRKGALTYEQSNLYENTNAMRREEIIQHILAVSGEDPILSTTGKASRELFEGRERLNQSHKYDFLTVGSMGHSSSIALGVAINQSNTKIWCVDGDGAVLMHMGSMAVIGNYQPKNMIHIIINNEAHETVGGMPTVAGTINLVGIAKACGYPYTACVNSFNDLDKELYAAREREELSLIEVKCAIGSREDLGRPTKTTLENKQNFMDFLSSLI